MNLFEAAAEQSRDVARGFIQPACVTCGGKGRNCRRCGGSGLEPRPRRVRVTFENGTATVVKVPALGNALDQAREYARVVWPTEWLHAKYEEIPE